MSAEGKLRILLVEDERTVRLAVKAILEGAGYDVSAAKNGQEGLELFGGGGFDIVLSDVLMPKMNGYELCANIRQRDSSIPFVFLTAKDAEVDILAGFGYGADDYISKGASSDILLARLVAQTRKLRKNSETNSFLFGGWTVDGLALELKHADGRGIKLSELEFFLLRLFVEHPYEVLNRDYLQT